MPYYRISLNAAPRICNSIAAGGMAGTPVLRRIYASRRHLWRRGAGFV